MDEPRPGTPAILLLSALPGWASERYGSLKRLLRPSHRSWRPGWCRGTGSSRRLWGTSTST
eukprot:14075458-Alexandrium_andersonii.AAC.1